MTLSVLLSAILTINELMASNAGEVFSPAINYDSWIELYNPGEQAVNLSGMYLSDDAENPKLWQMPSDVGTVPAKGYLVVWLGSNDIKSNQAPFKLDCDGGTIYLSDKNGELVCKQNYPEALSRTAYARKSVDADDWGWTSTPTPGESNAKAVFAEKRLEAPTVNVGSKLFTGTLNVKVTIPSGATLMYTTDGSIPTAPKSEEEEEPESPWINYIVNGDCEGTDATCFVCRDGDGTGDVNRITDGVGFNGSRGVKVHAVANAANDWTTQLFIYTPDHVWKTGEQYRFRMKVRADKATTIDVQSHKTPGEYISHPMLDGTYNVTTGWTEISYEGTITDQQTIDQSGGWGGWGGWGGGGGQPSMQTIAFNLNKKKDSDNNFYFDDISWELYGGSEVIVAEPSQKSETGEFTISKTTNYTFRLFRDGYLPSVPVTRSYIQTSNKYTLPVISIVGNKKDFTDPKTGFDCDGDGTNGVTGNGQDFPRNYNQDWDRPVNFSYLSPEGEMLFNQDVNIKASGGWTRSQRFRSFKLKASKIFDGQNRFDYSFFPQKPYIRSKTLLVRNGGNDIWEHNARFMDPALETIIQRSGIDLDVQSYVPVIEYVNGELRGVLNLREPNNDDFAYANWGYDDEEIDAFENMTMKNGTDEAINHIFELGRNLSTPGAYEELKTLLDIDEFTNYMAVTMFLDNDDWPNNNIKGYRSQKDGRYRFVSFDLDYAFALRKFNKDNDDPFTYFLRFKDADIVYDEGNPNREIVRLLLNLLDYDEYRRKFIATFCIVGGSVFEPARANDIVDELLEKVQPMCRLMQQQNIREGHDPERAANEIKNKLEGRMEKMAGHMIDFDLLQLNEADKHNVTISADTEGARIFIEGMEVPYADFNGILFSPVTIEAKAPAGYAFTGWKRNGRVYSSNPVISLPDNLSSKLVATFAPLSAEEKTKAGITPVRINEVSADDGIYVTEYFKRKDWVELYNTTDEPIDVEGMYLTDNPTEKPEKYQITKGDTQTSTIIPAHGYLIIWCDKEPLLSQLHASFKLDGSGDELQLMAADKSWTDRITYPAHSSDQTVGRYPDGSNNVYVMNVPTIGKANLTSSYAIEVEQPGTSGIHDTTTDMASTVISSSYNLGSIVIRSTASTDAVNVIIYNLSGQAVSTTTVGLNGGYAEMSVENLKSGVYVATVSDGNGHATTCKFVKH